MNGEPRSCVGVGASASASPARTTGNTNPHHTTPRSAGSASTKNAREPEQLGPPDRLLPPDRGSPRRSAPTRRRRRRCIRGSSAAPTRSPCELIVGLVPMPAAYAQTREPERVRQRGDEAGARTTAISGASRLRGVLPILEPRQTEQQRHQHEAAVHVHPDEHERRDRPEGPRVRPPPGQDPQRHARTAGRAISCGRMARFCRATQKPATLRSAAVRVEAPRRRHARNRNANAEPTSARRAARTDRVPAPEPIRGAQEQLRAPLLVQPRRRPAP